MKHCNKCNIDTDSKQKYCPLCYNDLEETNQKTNSEFYLTRTSSDKTLKTRYFIFKLFLFLTISIAGVCFFINFLTYDNSPVWWCLVVMASLVYVWILVGHNILSDRSMFEKIFFQFVGILAILLSSNLIAGGDWLIKYVLPSIAITAATVMIMITLITKKRANFISTFFVVYVLLFILSLVMVLAKFDTFKLLNQINLCLCALAIFGTLVFGFKTLRADASRKFHI